MLSAAYERQILENGGQIDNLKASQRQMQGCAPIRMCSVSASSLLYEDPVIEIEGTSKNSPFSGVDDLESG